ncbi:hypothetical protein AC249_AIPGENE12553, partial [Exaiptasia diaphana]
AFEDIQKHIVNDSMFGLVGTIKSAVPFKNTSIPGCRP